MKIFRLVAFILLICNINFFLKCVDSDIKFSSKLCSLEDLKKNENLEIKENCFLENDFASFVVSIPNGVVINNGTIITEEGDIFDSVNVLYCTEKKINNIKADIDSEAFFYFNGRLAVIASVGAQCYYHWLLQILPRLLLLKASRIEYDKIYCTDIKYKWQYESLQIVCDYLKIDRNKLLIVNSDCIIKASNLIVPAIPFIPFRGVGIPISKWFSDFFKNIFLIKNENINNFEKADKIYISRKNAAARKIKNEELLIAELKSLGFKILYLEECSIYEQAAYFNAAKIIVGPHGAGFANCIFTTPGYKLIEIDFDTDRAVYERFTLATGGKYFKFNTKQQNSFEVIFSGYKACDDIETLEFDIAEFIAFLKAII